MTNNEKNIQINNKKNKQKQITFCAFRKKLTAIFSISLLFLSFVVNVFVSVSNWPAINLISWGSHSFDSAKLLADSNNFFAFRKVSWKHKLMDYEFFSGKVKNKVLSKIASSHSVSLQFSSTPELYKPKGGFIMLKK